MVHRPKGWTVRIGAVGIERFVNHFQCKVSDQPVRGQHGSKASLHATPATRTLGTQIAPFVASAGQQGANATDAPSES